MATKSYSAGGIWRCGPAHTASSHQDFEPNGIHQPLNGGAPRPRHPEITPGDWPLRTSDKIKLPQQVMALFPGWFLRSVLPRESFTDSPIQAVERLLSSPRPLQDADKDVLVGAVLTMSSSLHLALGILQEILPREKSQERLGEVLCPTLGQLLSSLQGTVCSFERSSERQATEEEATPTAGPSKPANPRVFSHSNQHASSKLSRSVAARYEQPMSATPPTGYFHRPPSSSASPKQSHNARTKTESFPPLEASPPSRHSSSSEPVVHPGLATHLARALQAEIRVQAAIHVAVESLEFAEGQLKVVKQVSQFHGGNIDQLQSHFYEGYNRLLLRALELQRQEHGPAPGRGNSVSATPTGRPHQLPASQRVMPATPRQHSVSFHPTLSAQSPAATPRATGTPQSTYLQPRSLERRNTIQGIKQEDARTPKTRPSLKRRMSLADELALVGEDSESGYQDETSEVASSASELESDLESCNSRQMARGRGQSDGYSTNGESGAEESGAESDNEEDCGDRTLNSLDMAAPAGTPSMSTIHAVD
ncbi:hypothetical protein F5144DRAFT_616778 [Chaetomium tenue]|uniref:Uncharacterized protein n=1 Tax=Chaetomium tenue TaxID=1854479 RepID=A0ACB7PLD6_9PEZI|nr:hypothetical protein F5144DRAFT_616778 [Chaetomium globosum]